MLSLLLLNLLGCASPFEGTWLFLAERETKVTGDCVDPDDEDTTRSTGEDRGWVDIYRLESGEFAVLLGEYLVGPAEGNELQASWEEADINEDSSSTHTIEFEASLDGNTMSGKVVDETEQSSGDDTFVCTTQTNFTAERNVSPPDAYPDN